MEALQLNSIRNEVFNNVTVKFHHCAPPTFCDRKIILTSDFIKDTVHRNLCTLLKYRTKSYIETFVFNKHVYFAFA